MPRPNFLKSQFSIVSRNPDLIIPNSLFPVICDLHGAAGLDQGTSWFAAPQARKKMGFLQPRKEETLDF